MMKPAKEKNGGKREHRSGKEKNNTGESRLPAG